MGISIKFVHNKPFLSLLSNGTMKKVRTKLYRGQKLSPLCTVNAQ